MLLLCKLDKMRYIGCAEVRIASVECTNANDASPIICSLIPALPATFEIFVRAFSCFSWTTLKNPQTKKRANQHAVCPL